MKPVELMIDGWDEEDNWITLWQGRGGGGTNGGGPEWPENSPRRFQACQ